jgi:hypothetical protein
VNGYDDFGLGLHLGAGGQVWVSASSRLGHVHGVTSVKPGDGLVPELYEQLYDLLDAIRFAEAFDAGPMSRALGEVAFGEPAVGELFQAARGAAADRGNQLIVRVQASPHLAALPWELLPDPSEALGRGGPLTLAADAHVVRLSRGRTYPIRAEPLAPPLNLLVVLSSPMGERPSDDALTFDIYDAKRSLLDELADLEQGGWLSIDVEDRPTMENLRRRIGSKRRGYHLLHYLGHAEPDLLLLEDDRGRSRKVTGAEIVQWLRSCPDLRLMTFGGCETARPAGDPAAIPDNTDWQALLSLAERAAQGSSPVVLGMQAVLPFRTERVLMRALYQALASGNTIVDSLRLARAAVRADEQVGRGLLDWAIPGLFLNTAEPAPLLDRAGVPPPSVRRAVNVAKFQPPAAGGGLIGRDVPLRQAVEVLVGHTRERVLVIAGSMEARTSELLDRALDEAQSEVSDILSVTYSALTDAGEAQAFLLERDGPPSPGVVLRANLCAAVSQHLQRGDGRVRDRGPDWTLRRWWSWLGEDLASRRAVIAIDRFNALELAGQPLQRLAQDWIARTFSRDAGGDRHRASLERLVEHLRDPRGQPATATITRHLTGYDGFVAPDSAQPTSRRVLAEQAEAYLNGQPPSAGTRDAAALELDRTALRGVQEALHAVEDMIVTLSRRSERCRIALVVDDLPEGFLDDISDLIFPMRMGEITWPEMWRWVRRTLPGLGKFGQERVKHVWRKYLGADVGGWEELERLVLDGALERTTSPGDSPARPDAEAPETDLERLALTVCVRRRRRRRPLVRSTPSVRPRRDRPLVVAAAGSLGADVGQDSQWRLSFADFQSRLNGVAEDLGLGGRVTTTTMDDRDTLVVLVAAGSPFDRGSGGDTAVQAWYEEVGRAQPDIVLLDFGGPSLSPENRAARNKAFPAYRTLQIAAGGNGGPGEASFPAWDKEVFAVGALDEDGAIRDFSSRDARLRKPDVFAPDVFMPGSSQMGTSYSAAHAVMAAILVWTLLPERTPRGLFRFLIDSAVPLDPDRPKWPLKLDIGVAVATARRERVLRTLEHGRASLQAIVAMTGLNWQWAESTLLELEAAGRVASSPVGRDVLWDRLDPEMG